MTVRLCNSNPPIGILQLANDTDEVHWLQSIPLWFLEDLEKIKLSYDQFQDIKQSL